MNGLSKIKDRGIQILSCLKKSGPLSFRGLKFMMQPEIKDRRLHSSLARLIKNGLLIKRHERVFRGTGVFYQLSQDQPTLERVASVLKCSPKELNQPFFISRELLHSEACALWMNRLQLEFPDAKLIRDFVFHNNDSVHEVLLSNKNDFELLPDFIMILDGNLDQPKTFVAFEVERSRKSANRLLMKLQKYADETALDGIVYLCESAQVSDPVRQVFKTKVGNKSQRISHYSDYFLLSGDNLNAHQEKDFQMFNANKESVSLVVWINQLRNTPLALRRSKNFSLGAVSCSQSENHG